MGMATTIWTSAVQIASGNAGHLTLEIPKSVPGEEGYSGEWQQAEMGLDR
jgi:hypothetical protein